MTAWSAGHGRPECTRLEPVDRERLTSALVGRSGAAELCREDLKSGAHFEVLPGLVAADDLRTIYRRRAEHLAAQGIDSIGADEAADRLEETGHASLGLGKVDGGSSGYFFQVFFDPSLSDVIACLAVPSRPTSTLDES